MSANAGHERPTPRPTAADRCRTLRDRWYPKQSRPHQILTRAVVGVARAGAVIVDSGCGRDGRWLRRLAPHFGLALGFDLEIEPGESGAGDRVCVDDDAVTSDSAGPDTCSKAADITPLVLVRGDAHFAPVRSGSADVVVSKNTVEHFGEPSSVFAEFFRMLRPGGHLFVLTVNQWFPPVAGVRFLPHRVRQRINARATDSAPEDTFPVFYRANTASALRRLGADAGFECVSLDHVSHHPEYFMFSPAAYRMWALFERGVLRRRMFAGLRHFLLAHFRRSTDTSTHG